MTKRGRKRARIAVVADFNPDNHTHVATNAALEHAGADFEWVATEECEPDAAGRLAGYGGIFIGPASPYRSMEGALGPIRHARERGIPLVGT
jgi:CTP synthase (UTP-ammonia lyase)